MDRTTLAANLAGLTAGLLDGTISSENAFDEMLKLSDKNKREPLANKRELERELLDEPNVEGHYIPRDGTAMIIEHYGSYGSWRFWGAPFNFNDDELSKPEFKGGPYTWRSVREALPKTAFPLIPLENVETLKFTYALNASDDNGAKPEPREDDEYYIPRDGTGMLVYKSYLGNYSILKAPYTWPDRLADRNGGESFWWTTVKEMLPDSAFPLIPFKNVASLRFEYTLKEASRK